MWVGLIQYDWCSYKKEHLKNYNVRAQGKGEVNLQAKERGLRRNQHCLHIDLRL
jgi:hypothetical protein